MDNISTKRRLRTNEEPFPLFLRRTRLESIEELLLCTRHILEPPFAIVSLLNKRSPLPFFVNSLTQQLPALLLSRDMSKHANKERRVPFQRIIKHAL